MWGMRADRITAIARDVMQRSYRAEVDGASFHYLASDPEVSDEAVRVGEYLVALGVMMSQGACSLSEQQNALWPGVPTPGKLSARGAEIVERFDGCLRCFWLDRELKDLRGALAVASRSGSSARSHAERAELAAWEAADAAYAAEEALEQARAAAEEQDLAGARRGVADASEAATEARRSSEEVEKVLDEL